MSPRAELLLRWHWPWCSREANENLFIETLGFFLNFFFIKALLICTKEAGVPPWDW